MPVSRIGAHPSAGSSGRSNRGGLDLPHSITSFYGPKSWLVPSLHATTYFIDFTYSTLIAGSLLCRFDFCRGSAAGVECHFLALNDAIEYSNVLVVILSDSDRSAIQPAAVPY